MNFTVVREPVSPERMILGRLYASDMTLRTLELPWRENQPEISCIPAGRYRCLITWSDRYRKLMPRLMEVPGREGILIHPGNTTQDTMGCILVGLTARGSSLVHSRVAFQLFFDWLGVALKQGDVFCSITGGTGGI